MRRHSGCIFPLAFKGIAQFRHQVLSYAQDGLYLIRCTALPFDLAPGVVSLGANLSQALGRLESRARVECP